MLTSRLGAQENKNLPVISPADAAKHINQKCIVEMEVKSVGKSNDGKLYYLNSEEDYKDRANFGVVIDMNVVDKLKEAKITDIRAHFLQAKIRATGTITRYRDRPQLRVDEPEQIQVMQKKK
jgi:hypothetical protein